MTRKRIIIETAVFCLTLLILFVCAFLSFFFISRDALYEEIENVASVSERLFDGNDLSTGEETMDAFRGEKDYRISIIQRDKEGYEILYDSLGMTQSNEEPKEILGGNVGTFVTRKSSYGYPMVYYAISDKENPQYYVRVAIKESTATKLARDFLLYGLTLLVLLMLSYIFYRCWNYARMVKPLQDQVERLLYVAHSPERKIQGDNDVGLITQAIDDVGKQLDQRIQDLEREKEKTQLILDSIKQGFLAVSQEGRIILLNRKAALLFGYRQEEALGKDFHILSAGEEFASLVEKGIREGTDQGHVDIMVEGRIYQCDVMSLKDCWFGETRGGVAVLFLDVTKERNLVRIKTDFFANASHELKTPLTSILGYQEMLSAGFLTTDEEKKEAVDISLREAKKMKDLLNDMLTISRLENGKMTGEVVDFDLEGVLRSLLQDAAPRIKERDLQLETHLESYPLHANVQEVEKIFSNLIDNAIKYNHEGGKLVVCMNRKAHKVMVTDTGIGIKEENLSRIFERFYRVDNSKTLQNVEGTGLGLSIVKHICQKYGYHVEVRSVYGQGSTFTVHT